MSQVDPLKEPILRHIDPDRPGLEIGPCYSPAAPKRAGYRVDIVDHTTREELIRKYEGQDVDLDRIEEVDYIWRGEPYADLTGKPKGYGWVIASHVIEHTPDLIGFLHDCDSVLQQDGVLSLAVPDKRRCFDFFRPLTGLSKVIDNHLKKATVHSPGTIAEFYLNHVYKQGLFAWSHLHRGNFKFGFSVEQVKKQLDEISPDDPYRDCHSWCFVPHSFRLLIHDLHALGYIPFRELAFETGPNCDFFITLSRTGTGPKMSRMELAQAMQQELMEGNDSYHQTPHVAELKLAAMTAKVDQLQAEVAALRSSTSWKLTSPLRRVSRIMRRHPEPTGG